MALHVRYVWINEFKSFLGKINANQSCSKSGRSVPTDRPNLDIMDLVLL